MKLAVVFVHYHTEALLLLAVRAVLASEFPDPLEVEVIVVDNGSTGDLQALLPAEGCRLISPGRNLGYAGAVNLGIASTAADLLCFANPDVIVDSHCLARLGQAAQEHGAIVGPRFFLDDARSLVLPATERRTRRAECLRALATHHQYFQALARKYWRAHVRAFWRAGSNVRCYNLSGALLLFPRAVWERLGPLDAQYQLYFEETDWLARAQARAVPAIHVPAAAALHRYNQSAVQEAQAGQWMHASALRFSRRYYGTVFTRVVGSLQAGASEPGLSSLPGAPPGPVDLSGIAPEHFPLWIELAAYPTGYPGSAVRIDDPDTRQWQLPDDVWRHLSPGRYIVQVADDSGREWARWSIAKSI